MVAYFLLRSYPLYSIMATRTGVIGYYKTKFKNLFIIGCIPAPIVAGTIISDSKAGIKRYVSRYLKHPNYQ